MALCPGLIVGSTTSLAKTIFPFELSRTKEHPREKGMVIPLTSTCLRLERIVKEFVFDK